MRRQLILALVILVGLLVWQTARLRTAKADRARLSDNQTALMSEVEHYRSRAGQEAASTQVLRLKVGEFEKLREADARCIRDLGIKLRRVESSAKTASQLVLELRTALRDTIVIRQPAASESATVDTLRRFCWQDPWVTVSGLIDRDSVACRITSVDTLRQVIHRVPRRFLFIRWGTKAIRQEIVSANPHTKIVYGEFVKFEH